MAAAPLKRGEAIVWLPPRNEGERAFGTEAHLLALRPDAAGGNRLERVSLEGLQGTTQARLIVDARDVNLLTPQVPALTGARLLQALPNVIEDALLQDVAACAIVAGPVLDEGRRLVAVIDREWLEFSVGAFERRGIRVRSVWPAQLSLPLQSDTWSVSCIRGSLALRIEPLQGLGWSSGEDPQRRLEAVTGLLQTALALHGAPTQGIRAWVDDPQWAEPLNEAAAQLGWPMEIRALDLPEPAPIDLLSGREAASRRMLAAFDVRAWRAPALLAGACLAAALAGLNLHWAQLLTEKTAIRQSLEATFRSAFPSAQVVVDPVLQMNRQVAALRARSGQSGPEDFAPLLGRLGEALGPGAADALASVEYREGRLKVRFRAERVDGRAAREQLREACSRAGLKLQFDNEREPTATVGLQG